MRSTVLAWTGLFGLATLLSSASAEEASKAQAGAKQAEASAPAADASPGLTLETFLDRLMMAESSGRDDARNPRSTAVGAFRSSAGRFSMSSAATSPKRRRLSQP